MSGFLSFEKTLSLSAYDALVSIDSGGGLPSEVSDTKESQQFIMARVKGGWTILEHAAVALTHSFDAFGHHSAVLRLSTRG